MSYHVPRMTINEREIVIGKMGTFRELVKAHNALAECIEEQAKRIDALEAKLCNEGGGVDGRKSNQDYAKR